LKNSNSPIYKEFCHKLVLDTSSTYYDDLDPELKNKIKATLSEKLKKNHTQKDHKTTKK